LTEKSTKNIGLRGIRIADSTICFIDGENGRLYYRGFNIDDLAKYSSYYEVAYLLLHGLLPKRSELEQFISELHSQRELSADMIAFLQRFPKSTPPMSVLQSAVASIEGFYPEPPDESKDAFTRKATRLIAQMPTIVATWDRIRRNLKPITPDRKLSRAANFLYMLKGEIPDEETAHDFDVCLILHAEHAFNASSFAARVVASTRASMYAAVSAAIGSLSGELHGGANSEVMANLLEISNPEKVENWVRNHLDEGKRIMGMGHAVYKTMDPRAVVLKQMAENLAKRSGNPKWFNMTKNIEEVTKREFQKRKGGEIYPNVDLYSASVYYMMGITPDLYTPVFAISRIAGWAAHILEERFPEPPVKPMLYRPLAEYRGNYCGTLGCEYIPLEKRT
jgi:citrate synthase